MIVMIKNILVLLVLICLGNNVSLSQVEGVIVETYYITNADDTTDTSGGRIEEGAITYRLFVDMLPGSRIIAVYGDAGHPLVFTSTQPFFNHREDGVSFGKDFSRSRYANGIVPLDSYITLGQCSKSFAQGAYFGVPKEQDLDGSIVGGMNNDGGSAQIPAGLLNNDAADMGMPLTEADGMEIRTDLPGSWIDLGFIDLVSDEDTTIFGAAVPLQSFYGTNVLLKNSGVSGVDTAHNVILVAQLTTKGEITFELNIEAEILVNGLPKIAKYVARNESLGEGEIFEPRFKYPYACGCTDPDYLEASTGFACTDNSKCLTPVVFGCMDSLACNFNPGANFNIQDLCCYVGYCNDLDISIVCPGLRQRDDFSRENVHLHPNPAVNEIEVTFDEPVYAELPFAIIDLTGRMVQQGILSPEDRRIDISRFANGYYTLQFHTNALQVTLPFIKI